MDLLLEKEYENNNINHAYIFECMEEGLNISNAEEFVKKIFGNDDLKNNPDFFTVISEEKSIKVEQIRELQKNVNIKPMEYANKICIIYGADKMTEQAQNCLLKTFEGPPAFMIIILLVKNGEKLLKTIHSRARTIKIKANQLQYGTFNEAEDIINSVKKMGKAEILQKTAFFEENKDKADEILSYMLIYLQSLLEKIMLSDGYKSDIISFEEIANYIEIIEGTRKRIDQNCNFSMTIDRMLIKMSERQ